MLSLINCDCGKIEITMECLNLVSFRSSRVLVSTQSNSITSCQSRPIDTATSLGTELRLRTLTKRRSLVGRGMFSCRASGFEALISRFEPEGGEWWEIDYSGRGFQIQISDRIFLASAKFFLIRVQDEFVTALWR